MNYIRKIRSAIFVNGFLFIGIILLFSACSDEAMSRFNAKPSAFGDANYLVVVADKDLWEGEVGDTFQNYFSSAYLILPQPEPILDIRHFTPSELEKDPIRRELRTYVILGNIDDPSSPTAKLLKQDIGPERIRKAKEEGGYGTLQRKEKWAKDQLNFLMFGTDKESILANIRKNHAVILKLIKQRDKKLINSAVYAGGESRNTEADINQSFGLKMKIPVEYFIALDDPSIMWIRKETKEISSNILLHKIPYTSESQLSYEGFKSIRDSLGKKYIASNIEGSYMQINDSDLPMFVKPIEIENLYALEARGIWEMENDFMGGPFMSYLIHNPDSNQLYLLDGFVFAPGREKRNLMQHLEHILGTVQF